jgi:tetratricopeptide (TPR) repeat protein
VVGYQLNTKTEALLSDSAFSYVQRQRFVDGILTYNMLLKLNRSNPFYFFYRGVALYSLGFVEPAIGDWEAAVKFNVADTKKAASNNLSVAYDALGKDSLALYYVNMAVATGNNVKPDFIESVKRKAATGGRR